MSVPRRPLGRTGLEVPVLGHGTVPVGRSWFDPAAVRPLLDGLLAEGIDLFDTAAAYDDAEERLGRALEGRRDHVVLVSKTGMDTGYASAWERRQLQRLIDRSLARLRTDHLDVLLLHTCTLEQLEHGEVIEVLQEAQRAGKARCIGYSGDGAALAFALRSGVFEVIEASYSLLDQANHDLLAQAHKEGVGVLLKRPLANAVPGRTTAPANEYALPYWTRWQELGLTSADVEGLPWMEVALRFAAFADGVDCALVGSGSLEHMRAHVRALRAGPLPATVAERLRARFHAVGHQRWPGLT